jgi:hypothetical protein
MRYHEQNFTPIRPFAGQRYPSGYFGDTDQFGNLLATNVTVDLSPEATELITDTRRQIIDSVDVLSNEVAASVKLASMALVVAVAIGAVGFVLAKR